MSLIIEFYLKFIKNISEDIFKSQAFSNYISLKQQQQKTHEMLPD